MALARWQRTITTGGGIVLPSASVEVRRESDNGLASLFSDRAGTAPNALLNPFNADIEGFAAFHVIGGVYKITVTSGSVTRTWRYVGIGTAQEFDVEQLAITDSNLPDMLESTIRGRAAGAGTGKSTNLSKAQVHDILQTFLGRFATVGSTPLSLLSTDSGKLYVNSGANRTVHLPAAASGLSFAFFSTGGILTVDNGTIVLPSNSTTSVLIASGQALVLACDGTNWNAVMSTVFSVISPAQITSDQSNYGPTGQDTADVMRISVDTTRTIHGFANGRDGRLLFTPIVSGTATFADESGTATAANRFALPGSANVSAGLDQCILWMYDGTSLRWRMIGSTGGALDINGLTEDAGIDSTADFIPFFDTSEGANNKIKPQDLVRAGGLQLLAAGSVAAVASVDIVLTAFNAIYRGYKFFFYNAVPATDDIEFWVRVSTNAGSSYDTTGYSWVTNQARDGVAGVTNQRSGSDVAWRIATSVGTESISNVAGEGGYAGELTLLGPAITTAFTKAFWKGVYFGAGVTDCFVVEGGGIRETAQDTDAIRFMPESGNWTTLSYAMYGLI